MSCTAARVEQNFQRLLRRTDHESSFQIEFTRIPDIFNLVPQGDWSSQRR